MRVTQRTGISMAAAAALCCGFGAEAQESMALGEVVVTASGHEQDVKEAPASISVLDREDLEDRYYRNVTDALREVPGVIVTGGGAGDNGSDISIRGMPSSYTLILVDGKRQNTRETRPNGSAGFEQDFLPPLQAIDRIEVIRGPMSTLYGSDAIGGVIQLFTKRGEEGVSPSIGVGVGSHGLFRTEAAISGKANAFDYSFGVAHEESRGFNIQPLEKRTLPKDGFTSPDRDGYNTTSGNVRLGWQIAPGQRLEATALSSDTQARYDAAKSGSKPPAYYLDDQSRNRLRTGGLTWSAQWNEVYSTRLQVTDSQSVYSTMPSYYRTETRLRGYLFQNELRFGPHLVTAALERREDRLENAPTSSTDKGLARKRSQDAVSLGYGFVQGPHSLQLNVRHDDDSEFGGKTTGSAAYGFAITPKLRVTASAGTAFRAPTLYQRFSEYGKPDLQPEASRNVELGLKYTDGPTNAGIVVYRNQVRNLIVFDSTAKGCASSFGCYGSTARARYEGVTLSAGHRIGDVTLRASLDFQDPRDLATDKLLARRAKRYATLGADWRLGGWTLGAEVQTSSQRYDDAANTRTLGGYTLLNLVASTKIVRDVDLVARIDNAGDKDYMLARGYVTGGRNAYVGLKWTPQ